MCACNTCGNNATHKPTDRDTSVWLTPQDAADLLRVQVPMIRRLVNERRIPVTKVGRYVRINRNDLDAWLVANTRPATGGQ